MKLSDYLAGERGRAARLSRSVGQSSAYLSQMAAGLRPVRPDVAVAIEQATRREVTRWDLRPVDWHRIWPELIGADGAPDAGQQPPQLAIVPGAANTQEDRDAA